MGTTDPTARLSTDWEALPPGSQLDDYVIERRLGSGGFGAVYAGRAATGERVALKVLHLRHAAGPGLARFRREAEILESLQHPAIPRFIDSRLMADGRPYHVIEFLNGESLAQLLGRVERLPLSTVLPAFAQLAEALDHAHRAGIIHRDVKPANVFVLTGPAGLSAKLLDFGIAKLLEAIDPLTMSRQMIGTPAYMAPEQAMGKEVSAATDVYGLAATLMAVLVGTATVRKAGAARHAAALSDLPAGIVAIMARALATHPEHRYPTAAAFVAALAASDAAPQATGRLIRVGVPDATDDSDVALEALAARIAATERALHEAGFRCTTRMGAVAWFDPGPEAAPLARASAALAAAALTAELALDGDLIDQSARPDVEPA